MAALSLKIENRIDHVLDHFRTRDLSVLGHVTDKDQRRAAILGKAY
jgi:hypothetical protein